jgi:hypothetical protein
VRGHGDSPGTRSVAVASSVEACGSCHTFRPGRTHGTIDPPLDRLIPFARQAGQPLRHFVRGSIRRPDAYVEPGFAPLMHGPTRTMTEWQIDELAAFLVEASAAKQPLSDAPAAGERRSPPTARAASGAVRQLVEPTGELGDDAGGEHVRHLEDLVLDAVVVAHVGLEVTGQVVDGLLGRQREVAVHHAAHLA